MRDVLQLPFFQVALPIMVTFIATVWAGAFYQNRRMDDLRDSLNRRMDSLDHTMDRLETTINSRFDSIDQTLKEIQKTLAVFGNRITVPGERSSIFQSKDDPETGFDFQHKVILKNGQVEVALRPVSFLGF